MSSPDETAVPTTYESWQYVLRYLVALTASFAAISGGLLGYGLYERGQARDAEAILAGERTPETLKQAYTELRRPHLFAGWRVPDSILPKDDAVLAAVDEEALAAKAVALPASAFELPRSEAGKPPPRPATAASCKDDTACFLKVLGLAVEGPTSPRQKLFHYLALRHAMAAGRALSADELRFFRWNVTLWVRAFDRQIMTGNGTPTASDGAMLEALLESRQGANENALIFAVYGFVATAVIGLTLLLWWRWRRPEQDAAPAG